MNSQLFGDMSARMRLPEASTKLTHSISVIIIGICSGALGQLQATDGSTGLGIAKNTSVVDEWLRLILLELILIHLRLKLHLLYDSDL